MKDRSSIRIWTMALALGWVVAGGYALLAQSTPPTSTQPATSGQSDNPFPGEQEKTPAAKTSPGQSSGQAPEQQPAKPAAGGDNPFPGEDPNVPVIPVDGVSPSGSGSDSGRSANGSWTNGGKADADPDGDPVRSPDLPGAADDGFSSSQAGLKPSLQENDTDAVPGRSAKVKTREQVMAEDLDVGNFYLGKRNWKAAQGRFEAAFDLDKENADVVWGLAESERHLQLYAKAAEHYKLFLAYDPDGPHSKAARKALQEVEVAKPSSPAAKAPDFGALPKQ
jgi:hypothetical protein